ncbi:MAG: hypothetical protein IJW40_01730 [Clostridia bacterium]|nr:hypothetical protein [Clostridia bacterium]
MKKFLAMLLALCMILSCMTLVVAAEETDDAAAEGETRPTESNTIRIEAEKFNGGTFVASPEGGVLTKTLAPNKYGVGGVLFSWNGNETDTHEAIAYDITGAANLVVEMYVSHPDYLNGKTFEMEIGSDGKPDNEENAYVAAFSQYAEGGALVEGWNTITIPMTNWASGTADLTRMNDLRWFNRADQDGEIEIPEGVIADMNIGSIKFVNDAGETIAELQKDAKTNGGAWGGLNYTDFAGTRDFTMSAGADVGAGKGMLTSVVLDEPMDLTTYNYVDIYAKIDGADALKDIKFEMELTSSGECDKQESNYTGYFNNVYNGWSTTRVPLSAFALGDGADFSAINYIRLYTNTGVAETDIKFNLAYVQFSDSAATYYQEYTLPVGNEAALPENVRLISTASQNTDCMFADKEAEIVYEMTFEYIPPSSVYVVAPLGGAQALVQVAVKNKASEYVTIYDAEDTIPGTGLHVINVNDYINTTKYVSAGFILYIRVADNNVEDGNGGQIRFKEGGKEVPITVAVSYTDWEQDPDLVVVTPPMIEADEKEMTADEHSIPLFGCNAPVGQWTVDYKEFKSGSSSLSFKLGTWTEIDKETKEEVEKTQNGQSGFAYKTIDFAGEESIDATGMDTLEFWFYVSDKDALANAGFGDNALELTSAGTHDKEETNWRLPDILAQVTENNTWTAIRLPISGTATDWSRLNYMRWYFVNASNLPEEPIIIKIDNLRLTDYQAQQRELEKPAADAMVAKINEKIGTIPAFDDEDESIIAQYQANRDAWQAIYDELDGELKALSTIAQDLVSEAGAKKLLTNLNKSFRNYDNYLKDLEEQKNNPPEDETQTPGGDETQTPGGDETQTPGGDETQTPGDDTPKDEGGCGSAITLGAGAMMLLAAAWVTMAARKKED